VTTKRVGAALALRRLVIIPAAWTFAIGTPISRIVLIATGHPMDKSSQLLWVGLTLGWVLIGTVNAVTIRNQQKTITLLQDRQKQRDRAWLS